MRCKRFLDLVFSLAGLLLLSPLLVVLAVWIRIDSPGPVFFRQVRVGRHGRPFRIFKIRTMSADAEARGRKITVGADPRITRAGRFLRRFKLDELPQLFNVVRGEMSLVGPRPEVPRYVEYYPEEVRRQVLSVRPGITDFASILYRYESRLLAGSTDPEAMYVNVILPEKWKHYVRYVSERSTWLDLKIILLTLREVFGGEEGAGPKVSS
jgi:lipopolysaccharide/colanic/teichoic acid biosynthesis glycosyltransferase